MNRANIYNVNSRNGNDKFSITAVETDYVDRTVFSRINVKLYIAP